MAEDRTRTGENIPDTEDLMFWDIDDELTEIHEDGARAGPESLKPTLVGLCADPASSVEDWESDFDFDAPAGESTNPISLTIHPTSTKRSKSINDVPTMKRPVSQISAAERRELEELHATLPLHPFDSDSIECDTPRGHKLTVKDLLRDIQSTSAGHRTSADESDSSQSPRRTVEELEQELAAAVAGKTLQGRVSAYVELARAYRSSGQTGAAMVQLQHAQREMQERETKSGEDSSGSGQPNETYTEAHVLHEMAITARKIQDLNSAKGFLQRAIWAINSATSLSPLWSPLWLRLHVDAGGVMLSLGDLKTTLWHLSQHVAGLAARSCPSKSDSQPVAAAWNKHHRDLCAGCLYLGGTLHCAGVHDLARSFLQTSAGACEVLDKDKDREWLRTVVHPWLLCAIAETTVSETASLDEPLTSEGPTPKGSVQEEEEGDDTEEEEEEDWDKELEIEEEESGKFSRSSLSNMFAASRAADSRHGPVEEGTLPERWLLTKSLAEKTLKPVIVMYPKSSTLYSLRSKRIMTEASAQTWLEGLILAHREAYVEGRRFTEGEGTEPGPELCLVLAGTGEWAVLHVQHIFKLYKAKQHPAACWQRVQDFFLGLRACCVPSEETEARGWGDMDEGERVERIVLVRACQTLLGIAARLWKPDKQPQFQQFLFVARSAGLGRSDSMVELLELEGMGHHSGDAKAIVLPALCRLYETATARDKGGEEDIPVTVTEPQPPAESEAEEKKRRVEQWGRWRRGEAALEELGLSDAETRAAVLVDIQLCMEGLSPLTCGKPVGKWELGREASTSADKGGETPRIQTDEEYRLATILKLYQRIRPNLALRAKVALVLGSYELRRKEGAGRAIAEQLLLEAAFVLDTCCPPVPGISALVSELGERCLIRYGEALLDNSKYRYAVLSLEAAAECNLLRTGVQPHLLYRRLAVICADNGDYERSFRYYGIVLAKAKQEQKVDEYVFAGERVADILLEYGDFQQAEQLLGSAGLLLEAEQGITTDAAGTPTSAGARLDSRYVRLQLRVAKMLLDGYDTWRGVQLLKNLAAKSLPHAKKGAVQALLASGYYKVWQTAECDSCLASAEASTDGLRAQTGTDGIGLIRTGVKNLLREGRPAEALRKLDTAIAGEHRLSGLGQLYLLRGKVFQALAARAAGDPSAIPAGYSNALDVARAGAEALQMAWDAFSKLGDSMLQAKAASRYAQARLDAVWCSHVLLNRPWEVNLAETAPKTMSKSSPTTSPVLKRQERPFHSRCSRAPSLVGIPERPGSGSGIFSGSNRRETSDADALWSIERAAVLALDEAMATLSDLRLLLRSHLNMAEVRWLQGHKSLALAHFCECRELFFGLLTYSDGRFALSDGPISFARSALATLNRMTRFVLALDTATITRNLAIFDAVLHLEADINSLLQTGPAPGSGAEGGRRIWSLLHCMRSMGRQAQARRITREEATRRNHGALRKIWRMRNATFLHRDRDTPQAAPAKSLYDATVVPGLGLGAGTGDASPKVQPPTVQVDDGGGEIGLAPLVMSSRPGPVLARSQSCGVSASHGGPATASGINLKPPPLAAAREAPNACYELPTGLTAAGDSLMGRHVYMLCLMEQFVATFCPGTGLLELHLLGGGMGGGLLEDEAVSYVEGALKGSLSLLKDPEPKRKVARTALGRYRSSNKAATALSAAAGPSAEGESAAAGMGAVATSTLAQMLVKVSRPLLDEQTGGGEGQDKPEPAKAAAQEAASANLKPKRKPGRILKWLGCFATRTSSAKAADKAALAAKKDSLPDVTEKPSLPIFLACSAVLRAVPWEAVKLGVPMVRSLGVRPYKPPMPVDPSPGGDSGSGFGVVLLHSGRWQKRDEASFNGKRGALARNWLTAIQQRRWALPWRSGGPGDEGSASVWRWPLHAPLIRPKRAMSQLRRKYSHVTFLESDALLEAPQALPSMLAAHAGVGGGSRGRVNPVGREDQEVLIVVPFCELLRIPAALSLALASRPACTIAFCPDGAMKPLVKALKLSPAPPDLAPRPPSSAAAGVVRGEAFASLVRIVHGVMLDCGLPIALLTSTKLASSAPPSSGNESPGCTPGHGSPPHRTLSMPAAGASVTNAGGVLSGVGGKHDDREALPTILEPTSFAARRGFLSELWMGQEEGSTFLRVPKRGSAEERRVSDNGDEMNAGEVIVEEVIVEEEGGGEGGEEAGSVSIAAAACAALKEEEEEEGEEEGGEEEEGLGGDLNVGRKRKLNKPLAACSMSEGTEEEEEMEEDEGRGRKRGLTKATGGGQGPETNVVEGGGERATTTQLKRKGGGRGCYEVQEAKREDDGEQDDKPQAEGGNARAKETEDAHAAAEREEEREEEEEEEEEEDSGPNAGGNLNAQRDGLVHRPLEVESRSGPTGNKGVGVRSNLNLNLTGAGPDGAALARPGVVRIEFHGREASLSPPTSSVAGEMVLSPILTSASTTGLMATWNRDSPSGPGPGGHGGAAGNLKDRDESEAGPGGNWQGSLSPRPESEADSVRQGADGNPSSAEGIRDRDSTGSSGWHRDVATGNRARDPTATQAEAGSHGVSGLGPDELDGGHWQSDLELEDADAPAGTDVQPEWVEIPEQPDPGRPLSRTRKSRSASDRDSDGLGELDSDSGGELAAGPGCNSPAEPASDCKPEQDELEAALPGLPVPVTSAGRRTGTGRGSRSDSELARLREEGTSVTSRSLPCTGTVGRAGSRPGVQLESGPATASSSATARAGPNLAGVLFGQSPPGSSSIPGQSALTGSEMTVRPASGDGSQWPRHAGLGGRSSSFTSNSDRLPELMPGALVHVGPAAARAARTGTGTGPGSGGSVQLESRPASDGGRTPRRGPGGNALAAAGSASERDSLDDHDSDTWAPVTVPLAALSGPTLSARFSIMSPDRDSDSDGLLGRSTSLSESPAPPPPVTPAGSRAAAGAAANVTVTPPRQAGEAQTQAPAPSASEDADTAGGNGEQLEDSDKTGIPIEAVLEEEQTEERGASETAASEARGSVSPGVPVGSSLRTCQDSGSPADSDSSGWLAGDEARSPAGDSTFMTQSVIHEEPEQTDADEDGDEEWEEEEEESETDDDGPQTPTETPRSEQRESAGE